MNTQKFIEEAFRKEQEALLNEVSDLTPIELAWQPGPQANPIGWILWHMVRVEDMWIQFFAQRKLELWESQGWHKEFGMVPRDTGFGHTAEQVAAFPAVDLARLQAYFAAVRVSTTEYLRNLSSEDFALVPREKRPDMTIGSMFRQIIGELTQHLGQIAYIKGLTRSKL